MFISSKKLETPVNTEVSGANVDNGLEKRVSATSVTNTRSDASVDNGLSLYYE